MRSSMCFKRCLNYTNEIWCPRNYGTGSGRSRSNEGEDGFQLLSAGGDLLARSNTCLAEWVW